MKYINKASDVNPLPQRKTYEDLDCGVRESLLFKHKGWSYEREYRIVEKRGGSNDSDLFYRFDTSDLLAVVLGHCANNEVKQFIRRACSRLGLPLYTTVVREISNRIEVVPDGFRIEHDGRTFDEQLQQYYAAHGDVAFSQIEDS